jgi:outer membrane protein TolC
MPKQPRTKRLPSLRLAMVVLLVSGCACWFQKLLAGGETPWIVRPQNLDPEFRQEIVGTPTDMGISQSPSGSTRTLEQLDLPPITLREAIAMALRQSEVVRTLDGIESVTGFDPAIAEALTRAEYGAFAPELATSFAGSRINGPPNSFFGPGISTEARYDEADFIVELRKRWAYGTTTRIAHDPSSLGYLFFPDSSSSGSFNPAYASGGLFEIRQPLLRGFGYEVNNAPIRIAQSRLDQSRWQVEEVTIRQIRSVEESYWQLYSAHVARQAIQSVVSLAKEAVRVEELRYQAERSTYADVARTKVQLERLHQQDAGARLKVFERDNRLRQLIGIEPNDGLPLFPVDVPRRDPAGIDLSETISIAIQRRPDLRQRRLEVDRIDTQRTVARNQTLPQLDARYQFRTNGLSNRLNDAMQQAGKFRYTDSTIGIEFSMPLGNQPAKSRLSARETELARERARLREYERQVGYDISVLVAESMSYWEQSESALREVSETERWLELATIRFKNPRTSDSSRNVLLAALDDFQTAVQAYVNAKSAAAEGLAGFNIALARLEEAKGTSLDRWKIEFESGGSSSQQPMSPYSSYRAIGHESSIGAGHSSMQYRNWRRTEVAPHPSRSSSGYHQNSVRR